MFGLFGSKEKARANAESIIKAIHEYYYAARTRFPDQREILYLALAWVIYVKKHHPAQYSSDTFSFLMIPAISDTLIFSNLNSPDSIDALAYFMVHKERLSVAKEYEPKFRSILSRLKETGTETTMEHAIQNEVSYISALECLQGISEADF